MTESLLGDRYQLVSRVGSGGMAEVWEANDLSLGRRVAVKLLHPHLAEDPSILARFRSEAQSAARLTHPGIVAIYDTVTTERTDAIIMELVAGRDLRSVLDERRTLTVEDAVEVTVQLAQALGHAHQNGIIHRDVKPANVLVRPDRRVKISDFGIAKALDDSTFTDTGALVGTVKYLAPEQIQGNLVDGRTDLYSLTIVLYEMLCGEVPFSATDLIGAMDRMKRPAPSARKTRKDISPALDAFIAKGLARYPADRYADARTYVAALNAAQRPDATTVQSTPQPHTPQPLAVAPAPSPAPAPSIPVRNPAVEADAAPAAHTATRSRARMVWPFIATLLMIAAGIIIWLLLSPLRESVSDTLDTVDGNTNIETTTSITPLDSSDEPADDIAPPVDSDEGENGDTTDDGNSTESDSVDTSTTAAPETTSTTAAPPPPAPVVEGVAMTAFDPEGDDGLEHSDITNRAYDGDPTTFWYTQRYNSRLFGGLKGGVGLIIEFEEPRTVSQLDVLAGNPDWSARVYAASMPLDTLEEWGDPLRFFENNDAEATLQIPVVTAQSLLLWITDLGEPTDTEDEAGVRLEVFEVSVS